jgi:hypothetical protein
MIAAAIKVSPNNLPQVINTIGSEEFGAGVIKGSVGVPVLEKPMGLEGGVRIKPNYLLKSLIPVPFHNGVFS